jgi:hypothetical protein
MDDRPQETPDNIRIGQALVTEERALAVDVLDLELVQHAQQVRQAKASLF